MKTWFRGIAIALLIAVAAVLVKNEYGRYLLSHANYGMQALITGQEEGRLGIVQRSSGADIDGSGNLTEQAESTESSNAGSRSDLNLYIGSSMFRKGLDIHALDEGMNGTNYILAYNGTRAFQCSEELDYLLEKGVKIHHLYVDLYAFAMTADPWVEDAKFFLETNLPFKVKLWNDMKSYSDSPVKDWWEMFVTSNNERLLVWPIDYALTNRLFLRGGNLQYSAGYGVNADELAENVDSAASESDENGDTPLETDTGSSEVSDTDEIAEQTWNPAQEEYLVKLIETCRENQIDVTFIETPKYWSIMNRGDYVSLMKSYLAVLNAYSVPYVIEKESYRNCSAKEPEETAAADEAAKKDVPTAGNEAKTETDLSKADHVQVYSFDISNPAYYEDEIHLSTEGSQAFTRILTQFLSE